MTQLHGRCFTTQSPGPRSSERASERAGQRPGQSRAGPGACADPSQAPAPRVLGAEQKTRAHAALCWSAHGHAAPAGRCPLATDDGVDVTLKASSFLSLTSRL